MWPAVKRDFQQETFRKYVSGLQWVGWRPSLIVLHNTAAPTLAQWHETAEKDKAAGRVSGYSRILSLENYFRNDRKWSGGPHLFVADDRIWIFNPLTAPGVHSPSWNSRSIGIEMVADFDKEDDDSGAGLIVRRNAIFCTAVLCSALGLDPKVAVKLHREDPKTTHACPGEDFAEDRPEVIAQIIAEIEELMDGGEHSHDDVAIAIGVKPLPAAKPVRKGFVNTNDLNVRRGPGVNTEAIGELDKGVPITILDQAPNGSTLWLYVKSPAGHTGWVSSKYVTIEIAK